jgi:hypothetical protein
MVLRKKTGLWQKSLNAAGHGNKYGAGLLNASVCRFRLVFRCTTRKMIHAQART